jgi:hypothetical protein
MNLLFLSSTNTAAVAPIRSPRLLHNHYVLAFALFFQKGGIHPDQLFLRPDVVTH